MAGDRKKREKSEKETSFLNQLIIALGEAELKLEESYRKNDAAQFKNIKDFMLKIQNKISEEIK